jgi:exonuclease III
MKDDGTTKIAFNNIRGVKSKHYDLNHFVQTNHIDIMGLAETFLKNNEQVNIKGYNWVGKNRINNVKKSQGGIGFLIRDNMKILDDNVFDSKMDSYERLWIKVQFTESPDSVYYLATVYFPCEGTDRPLTDEIYVCLLSECLKIEQNDDTANIVVMGDFNGKIGLNPLNEDQTVDYNGQGLLNFCDATDLEILNLNDKCTGVYTWVRNQQRSVLDYVCVSQNVIDRLDNILIDDKGVYHLGSDHNMIITTLKSNYPSSSNNKPVSNSRDDIYWNIKPNQDWGPFNEALNTKFHNWDPSILSANEAWSEWKQYVISVAKETIGCKHKIISVKHGSIKTF